jgi:ATP adenylyltransferase
MAYVTSVLESAKPQGESCFICEGLASERDRENLLVLRTPICVVYMNRYPYTNGHLLVAPRAHKGRIQDLDQAEMVEIQFLIQKFVAILEEMMRPQGFNIGLNLGKVAGAGLPGHLHWHIVPRWGGDTNFMSVLSDVRVIIQSLDEFYQCLMDALKKEPPGVSS